MSTKETPMAGGLPTSSFRVEGGVLICSGTGMAEKRIPIADISGCFRYVRTDVPVVQLFMKSGGRIDLQDPKGELKDALVTFGHDFVSLDDMLRSSGQLHEDERLGRFVHSCGSWRLEAKVDLPFQADVPISFDLGMDTPRFPESMPQNVLWIEDNLGEIWNAAAGVINARVEAERISPPERFALQHLWANIPDAALDSAEWQFTVEVEGMYESFEVVFHGLKAVSCNAA